MTVTAISENMAELSRSKRLKSLTHQTHDALDKSIVAAASFDDLQGYSRFVEMQYLFHQDIAALYDDAALQAMREVSGPVVAIMLVLIAVFVPIAFLGGLTGELYRQFAITISISVSAACASWRAG